MTLRDDLLDEIEDDDRRRTVGALTDVFQTHLSRRDLGELGGEDRGE